MTIRFLNNIHSLDELRKAYLKAMKANHPDNGGDEETCKTINAEYDYLAKVLEAGGNAADASEPKTRKAAECSEAIRKVIEKIAGFQGVNIEIVGSWIWIDGATYQIKDTLKTLGFKWSRNRQKWHWAAAESQWHKGGKKTFEALRAAYGSIVIENNARACIA